LFRRPLPPPRGWSARWTSARTSGAT